MIVVEIQDPEDGRISHEIGPFQTESAAEAWKARFVACTEFDADFVEVHDIDRRLYDPDSRDDMDEIDEFYGG